MKPRRSARCPTRCGGCSERTRDCAATTSSPKAAQHRRARSADQRGPWTHARSPVVTGAAAPGRSSRRARPLSGGASRPGSPAGRPARAQFLATADGRGAVRRAARGAARQCHRSLHHQRPAQAAHGAHTGSRQAHRQRVGRRGAVLSPVQDHAASAHQHGQGRAEHDDPDRSRGLRRPTAST